MKKIEKVAEPREWAEYRKTPGADYNSIPELRAALAKEQGYICAYCMCRLEVPENTRVQTNRVEHIKCRERFDNLKLDYSNMVMCCKGLSKNEEHCDLSKKSMDISFSPLDGSFIETISYNTRTGEIKVVDKNIQEEINKIICLNLPIIKRNRLEVLRGIIQSLDRYNWNAAKLRRELLHWENRDANGMFEPYCGIVLWKLKKAIKQVK